MNFKLIIKNNQLTGDLDGVSGRGDSIGMNRRYESMSSKHSPLEVVAGAMADGFSMTVLPLERATKMFKANLSILPKLQLKINYFAT